jgi:hypothetical protein
MNELGMFRENVVWKKLFWQVVVCMNYAPVQTKGNATNLKS